MWLWLLIQLSSGEAVVVVIPDMTTSIDVLVDVPSLGSDLVVDVPASSKDVKVF